MELRPGARVDRYTLVEPLGQGGQGAVWKVVDPIDGVVRALKLIFLQGLDEGAAERARREAWAVAGAAHPALIPCRQLFEDPATGLVGLVFDFVPGQSLAEAGPRMTPEQRMGALRQIAGALGHVHGMGLLHRDLKPANVLVTDSFWRAPEAPGGVRLIDFGIAAQAGNPRPLTYSGMVIGTSAYLAPELVAPGRWAAPPDGYGRDVFAFGVLAHELLRGEPPTGLAPDAPLKAFLDAYAAAEAGQRPWPPPGLTGPWAGAIAACLEIDARRRPASGAALAGMLGAPPWSAAEPAGGASAAGYAAAAASLATAPTMAAPQPGGAAPAYSPVPGMLHSPAPAEHSPFQEPPRGPTATPIDRQAQGAPSASAASSKDGGRRGSTLIWIVLGVLFLAAGAAVALVFALRSDPAESRIQARPRGGPTAAALPEPPAPIPCCGKRGRCVSEERTCKPGPCDDVLLPERTWMLRLLSAAGRPEGEKEFIKDLGEAHPGAEICLRRPASGEEVCAPLRQLAAKGGARDRRLRITTGDLLRGELELRISDGGVAIAQDRIAPNREGLKSGVLCQGLLLYVGRRDTARVRLSADLDDP